MFVADWVFARGAGREGGMWVTWLVVVVDGWWWGVGLCLYYSLRLTYYAGTLGDSLNTTLYLQDANTAEQDYISTRQPVTFPSAAHEYV